MSTSAESERVVTVHFANEHGDAATAEGRTGQSLMEAARTAGIRGIAADCGGMLTCATCHVIVGDDWYGRLPAPDEDERAMLDFTAWPRTPGSRLSCQISLTAALDGLTVQLPPTQY